MQKIHIQVSNEPGFDLKESFNSNTGIQLDAEDDYGENYSGIHLKLCLRYEELCKD